MFLMRILFRRKFPTYIRNVHFEYFFKNLLVRKLSTSYVLIINFISRF
jgi:hypothetical protein